MLDQGQVEAGGGAEGIRIQRLADSRKQGKTKSLSNTELNKKSVLISAYYAEIRTLKNV